MSDSPNPIALTLFPEPSIARDRQRNHAPPRAHRQFNQGPHVHTGSLISIAMPPILSNPPPPQPILCTAILALADKEQGTPKIT